MHHTLSRPRRAAALLLILVFSPATRAERVSLAEIPALVRARSPELASLRRERGEILAAGAAAGWREEPSWSLELKPSLTGGAEGTLQAGYTRPADRPERSSRERAAALARLPGLEARLLLAERDLALEATLSAVRLLARRERDRLLDAQTAAAEKMAEFLSARAAAGEVSALDARRAGLEAARARAERAAASAQRIADEGILRGHLRLRADEPLELAGELTAPGDEPAGAPSMHPEIRHAEAEALAADAEAAFALEAARPSRSVTWFAELERAEDEPEGVGTGAFAGVALVFPLPASGLAEARAREPALRAERLRAEGAAAAETLALRGESLRAELHAHRLRHDALTGEPAREAAALEEETDQAWRTGQADFAELLRARAARFEIESARLDALEAWHLTHARLLALLTPGTLP